MLTPRDPATAMRFGVVIGHKDLGPFTGCEVGNAEYEILEYQEGGANGYVHRLPGRLKYANIKLTRSVDGKSGSLAAWFSSLRDKVERSTGSITAYDTQGQEIARWDLIGVYPLRYTGPSFSADDNKVAKETLELVHNGFRVASHP